MINFRHMSIQIVSWLKVVSLSIILSFGIQFVQAWTSPNTTPPGGNVSGPITTGSTAQTKNGPLTVSGVLKSNAGGFLNQGVLTTGNVSLNSWGSWLVLGDVNSSWNSWHDVNLQSGLIYADAIISPTFCLNSIGNLSNCITSWPSGGGGGGGDMTGVLAGTGLTGGGLTGDVTLSVDTNLVATKAYVDGKNRKVCGVLVAAPSFSSVSNSWADSINVPDTWTITNCRDWAKQFVAAHPSGSLGWKYSITCLTDSGYTRNMSSGGVPGDNGGSAPASPGCGW